jgi:hypothetical protein
MTTCAARIGRSLLAELDRIDDGSLSIAEINRRLGAAAECLGTTRPSYERVRALVHERRGQRRRVRSTLEVLAEVSTRARPPEALLDHISGIGVPRPP